MNKLNSHIHINIEENDLMKLKAIAKWQGISLSSVSRIAIKQFIAKIKKDGNYIID